MVKDATRGATLEVVVSRMKAVNAYRSAQNQGTCGAMRIVAVSATIPNITDVSCKLVEMFLYNCINLMCVCITLNFWRASVSHGPCLSA